MTLTAEQVKLLVNLRRDLHAHPQVSEQEGGTKERLMAFLRQQTTVKIVDKGAYFYALKDEGEKETIAFRADMDAIVNSQFVPHHGCGHDGHSTILCGLALLLDGEKVGRNIVYLFQHAEENGAGAKVCCEVLKEVGVDRIYGLHNWPHLTKNEAHLRVGTLMCASTGVKFHFAGLQSHASEPEKGKNPMYAIARLATLWRPLSQFSGYGPTTFAGETFSDMILATIISSSVGENNFGVSPGEGWLNLTIRAAKSEDLDHLLQVMRDHAQALAAEEGLTITDELTDTFPDISNSQQEVERVEKIFSAAGLPVNRLADPIRSSEDFGWYTKEVPGCFFFLGDGDCAELHSDAFEFPDDEIERGVAFFAAIAQSKD